MIPKPFLHIASCVALLNAVACDRAAPIEPGVTRRLIGRMTKHPSASDSLTLVWEVEAVRR